MATRMELQEVKEPRGDKRQGLGAHHASKDMGRQSRSCLVAQPEGKSFSPWVPLQPWG